MDAAEVEGKVRRALAELGDTPGGIAARLHELGVRGRVGCESSCPLAVHLGAQLGEGACCYVGHDEVYAYVGGGDDKAVRVELPPACAAFVGLHDDLRFPFLVEARPAPAVARTPAAGEGA
jgi:hypothetical protein